MSTFVVSSGTRVRESLRAGRNDRSTGGTGAVSTDVDVGALIVLGSLIFEEFSPTESAAGGIGELKGPTSGSFCPGLDGE